MKLLVAFALACLTCAVILGWYVYRAMSAEQPSLPVAVRASAVPQAAQVPDAQAPPSLPSRKVADLPTTRAVTAPEPPLEEQNASTPVKWADNVRTRDAARRLAAARETLDREPYHETALRDAIDAAGELQDWDAVDEFLMRLIELYPGDAALHAQQGIVRLRLRRFTAAVRTLERAVQIDETRAEAWFNLAVAHQSLGHLADARRCWDRTIELAPSTVAHAQRGTILLDLKLWHEAAADFEAVLREEPDAADAVLNLALALENSGREDSARSRLMSFVQRRPRAVAVLNRLAELDWDACEQRADEQACARVIVWCKRSLVVDADQPGVQALLELAETVDEQ